MRRSLKSNEAVSKELLWAKKRLESVFEANAAGIFVVDENRDITMVNQRFCDIVGFTKDELVGQNACFAHVSPESCLAFRKTFLEAKNGAQVKIEYFVRKKGCAGVWVEMFGSRIDLDETHEGVIWSIVDISERKAAEEAIKNLAFYDPLTGLVNRRLLEDRLSVMLSNKQREGHFGAVMFIDLDDFKALNDDFGHQVGDAFLKEVASRLLSCVRRGDTVARIGGDEFVIAIEELGQSPDVAEREARRIAEKALVALSEAFVFTAGDAASDTHAQQSHTTTASVGVALFNRPDDTRDAILRRADQAMYRAKNAGKNGIGFAPLDQ